MPEARAGDRVVGGLLVRGERHAIGERRRHRARDARRTCAHDGARAIAAARATAPSAARKTAVKVAAVKRVRCGRLSGDRPALAPGHDCHDRMRLRADARPMCENMRLILREFNMPQDPSRLIWIDLEMTGLKPDTDRIIEMALVITDSDLDAGGRGAGLGASTRATRCSTAWTPGTRARTARSGLIDKVKASLLDDATRGGAGARVPARARAAEGLADVRQFDLPGPALPRALDAGARRLLPLSQPGRVDAEGARAALEAGADEGRAEGRQARGARRRLRIDRRAQVLPRALHPRR